jgi:hypothetical protein
MSLLSILADLSGVTHELRELYRVHIRIAEALERISPPVPLAPAAPSSPSPSSESNEENLFSVAESGEEYEARRSSESALAMSLGVAPWSPAFQKAIDEMRADLMRPRIIMEPDDEGKVHRKEFGGYSGEEADWIVRDAFQLAKAQANELKEERKG